MRIGVAGAGGLDARVEPDELDDEVGGDGIRQQGEMGVGRGRGIGRCRALSLLWAGLAGAEMICLLVYLLSVSCPTLLPLGR